jgi:hypothetical protein
MCILRNLCHLLSGQKWNQCSICKDMQNKVKKDTNIICMVVTGDESWVYGYDADSRVSQRLQLNQCQCWTVSQKQMLQRCFLQCAQCINTKADYLEGNNTDL